jgi:ABC-type branched-subunit amino acid transport system substrate-binding protein
MALARLLERSMRLVCTTKVMMNRNGCQALDMFKSSVNKFGRPLALLAIAAFLSACELQMGSGVTVNSGTPVQVAMLVPSGSEQTANDLLAASLQNAAEMAAGDLNGVKIDLRIYPTGGNADGAAEAARTAASDGAKIILGPVFADSANAAGKAVRDRGLSVLAFSNNSAIAGGNVYILGNTFANSAERILSHAKTQGLSTVLVVHAQNLQGEIGRDAVQLAAENTGMIYVGSGSYEFTQLGVVNAIPDIAKEIKSAKADLVVFASNTTGALPIMTQLLRENGVEKGKVQFAGLTRWDIPATTLDLPGIQGGWFTRPADALMTQFENRYRMQFDSEPHPIAGLAYDGIAAIGALVAGGGLTPFNAESITQAQGFAGVSGAFRFNADGTNERSLSVARIVDRKVEVVDPAKRSFANAGS